MLIIPGPLVFSHFRMERILNKVSDIIPQVTGISAEYLHFIEMEKNVSSNHSLSPEQQKILNSLLDYGPSRRGHIESETNKDNGGLQEKTTEGILVLVIPKPGTNSPWSRKATEIAHYCHLKNIKRIERGIAYYIQATERLIETDIQTIANMLHDRMTEIVLYDINAAEGLFEVIQPKPLTITSFIEKRDSSHKVFDAQWIMDGVFKSQSLFSMIKHTYESNPRGILSAYQDKTAVIAGGDTVYFYKNPLTREYQTHIEPIHTVINVETHSTNISPYSDAAFLVSEEIRDEAATGRGARSKAGMLGFYVSNLEISGFSHPWETNNGKRSLEILLEASKGVAHYANEFGRPILIGFLRTFQQYFPQTENKCAVRVTRGGAPDRREERGQRGAERQDPLAPHSHSSHYINATRGYHTPIMVTGGLGNIRHMQVHKGTVLPGMWVIVLGLGEPDKLQRQCQEVIDACSSLGHQNPIVRLQSIDRKGLLATLAELLCSNQLGGKFNFSKISFTDSEMSASQIWNDEVQQGFIDEARQDFIQQGFILVIKENDFEVFKKIARREACPFAVIGETIRELSLQFEASSFPLDSLLGNVPRPRHDIKHVSIESVALNLETIDIEQAVFRLLRLPCIADKLFLISIHNRSSTGLVVRDALVGPWQVAVADCTVTAGDFEGFQGEAMAVGERPLLALIDPRASARMSVGEAITNIASACIGVLSDVRLSTNWMAAANYPGEAAHLYDAVKTLGLELCPSLNITIPLTTESLSMQTVWEEHSKEHSVVPPLSVVITSFAPVMDVRRSLTPALLREEQESQLIFIDLSGGNVRLGGSALAQVYGQLGDHCPDFENPSLIKHFFSAIQQLNLEEKILAYHDRSDGGLFITLCEMAFAGHTGVQIDITALGPDPRSDPKAILFNEELGAVIQVRSSEVETVLLQLKDAGLEHCYSIGSLDETNNITIIYDEQIVFSKPRVDLQKAWSETSYHIRTLRDNPRTAKKEFEVLNDEDDPGLNAVLTFNLAEDVAAPYVQGSIKPKIAILREQGTNGHMEMAAAFHRAGFTPIDVHVNDLASGDFTLSSVVGLAVCDGASFANVLGAGRGFAKRILFDSKLRDEFQHFFHRPETFTLGINNGAQMLCALKSIIPGTELWPHFLYNYSEQFEGRLCLVEVEPSPSILFEGMAGSIIPVPVAHAEGRAEFETDSEREAAIKQHLITLRYVDSRGRKTNIYPANPDGSPLGITGLTTRDGRINVMMPHPERAFRSVQYSWCPREWKEEGPWLRLFRNARKWVGRQA